MYEPEQCIEKSWRNVPRSKAKTSRSCWRLADANVVLKSLEAEKRIHYEEINEEIIVLGLEPSDVWPGIRAGTNKAEKEVHQCLCDALLQSSANF